MEVERSMRGDQHTRTLVDCRATNVVSDTEQSLFAGGTATGRIQKQVS